MNKKASFVYPNTSDLNRGGRGGLFKRFEISQLSGCEYIEMPADFIKNKTEVELTGLDLGCYLNKEAIAAMYEAGSPSNDVAYILHSEPSLPRSDGHGLTHQVALEWFSQEWVSRLTEMLLLIAHHLSIPPSAIEIHPGDSRNSVSDLVNAVRFIQSSFESSFSVRPRILLENRTEQFISTGYELATFASCINNEEDLKFTVGIILDIQQLFTRTKGNFTKELGIIPPESVKGFHIHTKHRTPSKIDPIPWDKVFFVDK